MLAAENSQRDTMRPLLAAGADPKYALEHGWTALHHAVDSECDGEQQTGQPTDAEPMRMLLGAGADPDAVWTSPAGNGTPLDVATRYGCNAVMSALTSARSRRDGTDRT